ncbi:MAG: glutaminyl-peptide cyclotransferase [Gammaproteobacteria bacterium]
MSLPRLSVSLLRMTIVARQMAAWVAGFICGGAILTASADDQRFVGLKDASIQRYELKILGRIPHNPRHFTQGLSFGAGSLWESTGGYGQSKLIRYRWAVSHDRLDEVDQIALPAGEFGEGLALLGNMVYQLTWKEGVVHRYKILAEGLSQLSGFKNQRQGWGLTTDGTYLLSSDGSDALYFLSPLDFSLHKAVRVRLAGEPLTRLNELEWVNGLIWANVWGSSYIVAIHPDDGTVTAVIDGRNLVDEVKRLDDRADVLNGIAWDQASETLLLTGKLWPWIYRVALVEQTAPD